jgi:hypothetical protein
MGVADSDTDEGAAEMLALSHRDRALVSETIHRLSFLQEGDDITHACEIVLEALRRGDPVDDRRDDAPVDGRRQEGSVTGNGTSAGSASPSAGTGLEVSATSRPNEAADGSVAAHRLLNSSAVVSMGISTLLTLWESLSAAESKHLLVHMATHATAVDDGLKLLTLGLDSEVPLLPRGSNGSARAHRTTDSSSLSADRTAM